MKLNLVSVVALSALLLCLHSLPAYSQDDFSSSERLWDKGPLTLADFSVRDMWTDDPNSSSFLYYGWNGQDTTLRFGNLRYRTVNLRTSMDRVNSWIRTGYDNEATLKYNQVAFNIAELYRRKFLKELDSNNPANGGDLEAFYHKSCVNMVSEYKGATNQGLDQEAVERYRQKIAKELAALPDIRMEPGIQYRGFGLGMHFGAGSEFFFSDIADYITPLYGIQFGFEGAAKRFRFNATGLLGFGEKLKKDIKYWKRGEENLAHNWSAGESFTGGNINQTIGYAVIDNNHFVVAPMVGFGAGFLDRKDKYIDPELKAGKTYYSEEIAGFRTLAGVMVDWKMARYFSSTGWGKNYGESDLKFLLYAARSNFRSPCASYSLNFGVCCNLFARAVK